MLALGKPDLEFGRSLQRDAANAHITEVGQHQLGRLLQVHAAAAHHGATLFADHCQQLVVVQRRNFIGRNAQLVARLQHGSVVLLQIQKQLQRHQVFVVGIAPHGTAGRQVVAAFLHDDARPQHAGRVPEVEVIGQHDALLQLGHTGLITGLGLGLAAHGVDQRGLAHIGHAADQHAHGLGQTATRGRQQLALLDQTLGGSRFRGVQRNGARLALGVVPVHPGLGLDRIGHILLVEYLQARLVARHLLQQGVGAGAGQARIQNLDDHIDFLDALRDGLTRQMHVTGKPLDGHKRRSFFFAGCEHAMGANTLLCQ